MKFLSSVMGLIFSICLSSVAASPLPQNAPSPSPSASVSAKPPKLVVLPIPSAAPTRAPDAKSAPPNPVPPAPQREAILPPPQNNSSVPRGPVLADLNLAVPHVELWRTESQIPQKPGKHRGRRFELGYVVGTEPALMRLQFPPVTAGNTVIVKPGPGVTVDPPEIEQRIGPTGECVVSVSLAGSFRQSDLTVYYVGVKTTLPLARASREIVAAQERSGR